MARQSRFRACPLCEAICGLELQYEGEALVAIRGDAADPFSRGHVCPKGNAILDLEADPDRLSQPLRRRGADWEEIGWDEALAEAGERLAAIQRKHGLVDPANHEGDLEPVHAHRDHFVDDGRQVGFILVVTEVLHHHHLAGLA
jgi:anaerobic selenocysteine-containing dehydrogenase